LTNPPAIAVSPERQLDGFLAKYTPEIEALARAILAKMRTILPGAVEMVYDNYNALVVGFGATEKASEALFSVVMYPRYVSLCFLSGASLDDPLGLLQGSGNVVRHIRLEDVGVLDRPAVRELMDQALVRSPKGIDEEQPGRMIIKSISAKQRPRRPTA
jgi:hypothetical protein